MPVAMRRFRPATRTMKNSSRFVAKMAKKRTRSSNGTSGFARQFEHAAVEVEPARLAVDEPVGREVGRGAVVLGDRLIERLDQLVAVSRGVGRCARLR